MVWLSLGTRGYLKARQGFTETILVHNPAKVSKVKQQRNTITMVIIIIIIIIFVVFVVVFVVISTSV